MTRAKPVVIIVILAALTAVFFWPVLAHPSHLMTSGESDLVNLFAARTHYQVTNTLESGELTLWDPYADCGAPVVGNIQNSTFYPLSILFYVMPTDSAFGFIFLGNTLLAGFFAYLFVRSFGLSRGAGLAGAVMYMFSGIWTFRIFAGHIMVYNNLPWIILGLYLVRKTVLSMRDGKWNAGVSFALLLAVSQAAQFLGGHTQFWVYSTFFLVTFGLFEVLCGLLGTGKKLRFAAGGGMILAALVLGVVLVMIQLLPAIEFSRQVLDDGKRPMFYRTWGGLASYEFVMAFVPFYYGSAENHSYWGIVPQWEIMPYVGMLPLILLGCVLFIVRNRYVWYFCAVGVFAVYFSLGNESALCRLMVELPGLSAFRVPARMLTAALPAGVVLTAFAWDRLFSNRVERSAWALLISVGVALSLGAWMSVAYVSNWKEQTQIKTGWHEEIKRRHDCSQLSDRQVQDAEGKTEGAFAEVQRELLRGTAICVLSAALFAFSGRLGRVRSACGLVAVAVIAADLMSFGMPFVKTLPVNDSRVYPEHTPLLDCLNGLPKEHARFRICEYPPPTDSLDTYRQLRRCDWAMVAGDLDSSRLKYSHAYIHYRQNNREVSEVNNALNVKYYISDKPLQEYQKEYKQSALSGAAARRDPVIPPTACGDTWRAGDSYVTENLECFPRAWVVQKVVLMAGDTPEEMMAFLLTRNNIRNLAVIEENPAFPLTRKSDVLQPAAVTDYRSNRVTVEVTLDNPGFLVLSEAWYPDWHAYDVADGGRTELHVYRTNVAMRGVFLKAGKHKVTFIYEPRSYFTGKTITLIALPLTLIALAVCGVVALRRRNRQGEHRANQ
jgi:hypothetical protein